MMSLDFFFADNALKKMQNDLESANLNGLNLTASLTAKGIATFIGKEEAQKVLNDISLFGSIKKMPQGLNHTLLLTDLHFTWNPAIRSFLSAGSIGIMNIGKVSVNKYVNGYIELGRRRTGDVFTIYLEISPSIWYFFSYSNSVMQALSSNNDFNEIISGIKEVKRTLKSKNAEEPYLYIISTPEKRIQFLRKMQAIEK
jgi:hypothetical protein